jgi:hypothetical protein
MAGGRCAKVPTAPDSLPTLTVALPAQLRVPQRQLQAERHRLGVNAVGAADHRRPTMLERALAHRRPERLDIAQDQRARLPHLQRLRRVDDVG